MGRAVFSCAVLALLSLAACGSTEVGASCSSDEGCRDGLTCRQDFPEGYCTAGCTREGIQDTCPDGSLCGAYLGMGQTVCLARCEKDGDCREGYACAPVASTDQKACRLKVDVPQA